MHKTKTVLDSAIMDVTISRRSMLKNTAKISGGALALSLFGGATALAGASEANAGDAVSVVRNVAQVADDNFWIGGF